jgi:hypothetical protein
MPSSLTTLLIVAFACMFLGTIAGLLLGSLRGEREEEPEDGEESPPGGRPGNYTPIARMWQGKKGGEFLVELDGKSYLTPDALNNTQRHTLEKSVGELASWLGVVVANEARPSAAPQTRSDARPAQQPKTEAIPLAAKTQSGASHDPAAPVPPEVTVPPATPHAPVGIQVAGIARAIVGQPVTTVKEEPKSIVGQINTILHEMLEGTPLEERGISLIEDMRKGVIVNIGLSRYEGIDSVPDPEIKKVIRSAVAEWERRQE